MHPGPVNRGVELSGRGRRLAPGRDHRPGRGRRGRAHGGALRAPLGARARGLRATEPQLAVMAAAAARPPPAAARGPAACATSTCSTRASGLDARLDVLVRERPDRRARRGRHARREEPGVEFVEGDRRHLLPAFVDPHVHLRTPGQEHKEDLETRHPRGRRGGRLRRRDRDAEHRSGARLARRCCGSLRDARGARGARSRSGSWPRSPAGSAGEELTEMAELREERRARLHRRRPARRERGDAAQGASVPAPLRRRV